MYDGMINVYKEQGFTSHDVVAKLRGILHQKKIGHTGTLDPDAVGVLPVCLGKGTKLCDMITDHDKTYVTEFKLGITTDTQDISGTVLKECPVTAGTEDVISAVMSFEGEYLQVPPMYSAIKIGGKKLYEIARTGKEIERPARPVTIYRISDIAVELPFVRMTVACSKGTYIRTLCHDVGEKLGCGACMTKLTRSAAGAFDLSGAKTLEEIETAVRENPDDIGGLLIPVEKMLEGIPRLMVNSGEADKMLKNGNILQPGQVKPWGDEDSAFLPSDGMEYRIYDLNGAFTAVYFWTAGRKCLKNKKMFI